MPDREMVHLTWGELPACARVRVPPIAERDTRHLEDVTCVACLQRAAAAMLLGGRTR